MLRQNKITVLIDVRSIPRSQYFPAFNDATLNKELAQNDIEYLHFKNEFGARQEDKDFYTNGVMNFEKFAQSKQFIKGINDVKTLLTKSNVCLMCAEIDPLNCHRAILCAKALHDIGVDVEHIIVKRNGEVSYESHNGLEKRLLDLYKKQTDDSQIAYRLHNQKIGYTLKNE
jgi:uncharacterized protein (DUF488 family)